MKIEHVGLWVQDLEAIKNFYETYFGAISNQKYHNKNTGFTSYFLTFDSGSRLEIMHQNNRTNKNDQTLGYAHLAFNVGQNQDVDKYIKMFIEAKIPIISGPRTTGDGYYEAVVLDPEGNQIEITANKRV